MGIEPAGKNNKGDYERARDRWNCALICISHEFGRNAKRLFQIGILMLLHTSRHEFRQSGQLEGFPSLARLAFMAGLSEKTVRRAIKEMAGAGLLSVKHGFNTSNRYRLTIPPAAAQHSAICLDLLTNPRQRRGHKRTSQVSGGGDRWERKTLPSVHLHSEGHSDLHSISKSVPSERVEKQEDEKRLSEEDRKEEGEEAHRPIAQTLSSLKAEPDGSPSRAEERPSLEELRVRLDMPGLGRSIRRMH